MIISYFGGGGGGVRHIQKGSVDFCNPATSISTTARITKGDLKKFKLTFNGAGASSSGNYHFVYPTGDITFDKFIYRPRYYTVVNNKVTYTNTTINGSYLPGPGVINGKTEKINGDPRYYLRLCFDNGLYVNTTDTNYHNFTSVSGAYTTESKNYLSNTVLPYIYSKAYINSDAYSGIHNPLTGFKNANKMTYSITNFGNTQSTDSIHVKSLSSTDLYVRNDGDVSNNPVSALETMYKETSDNTTYPLLKFINGSTYWELAESSGPYYIDSVGEFSKEYYVHIKDSAPDSAEVFEISFVKQRPNPTHLIFDYQVIEYY